MALTAREEAELLRLLEEERRDKARDSLDEFCRYVPIPGVPVAGEGADETEDGGDLEFYPVNAEPAEHHRLINAVLERVDTGEITRAMFFMPPGSAKSTYISVTFPARFMARRPGRNVIGASYSSPMAKKFGRRCRSIVRSKEFAQLYPHARLSGDNSAVDDWSLTNGSTYMSGGILSGITGNRADLIPIDDPIKGREDADSEPIRQKTWDEYKDSLRTRLKPGGRIVLVQTRWHEDDLAGRILPEDYDGRSGWVTSRDGERWYVVNLPAECEREDDPLGREIGEFLWTDWFPVEHWQMEKRVQAGRTWNALYQQRPSPEEGDIYKRGWWKPWDKPKLPHILFKLMSFDTAFEDKDTNDYSAITTWGIFEDDKKIPRIILLGAWRDRVEYPGPGGLRAVARAAVRKHKPDLVLIEKKASGHVLIQDLRRTVRSIVAVNPEGSKSARARVAATALEAGNVYFVKKATTAMVIEECARLKPGSGGHDDLADTVTMALTRFIKGGWAVHPDDRKDREEEDRERKKRRAGQGSQRSYY